MSAVRLAATSSRRAAEQDSRTASSLAAFVAWPRPSSSPCLGKTGAVRMQKLLREDLQAASPSRSNWIQERRTFCPWHLPMLVIVEVLEQVQFNCCVHLCNQ